MAWWVSWGLGRRHRYGGEFARAKRNSRCARDRVCMQMVGEKTFGSKDGGVRQGHRWGDCLQMMQHRDTAASTPQKKKKAERPSTHSRDT